MTRPLPFLSLVLLAAAVSAQAQSVVVTRSADGSVLTAEPTATPVADEPAALVVWTGEGWLLRTLSSGDVPTEVAAQSGPMHRNDRRVREMVETFGRALPVVRLLASERAGTANEVRYTVSLTDQRSSLPASALADLAEDPAFVRMAVSASAFTKIEIEFSFDSVAKWAAWTEQADLEDRFEEQGRLRTQLDVRRRPGASFGEIIDDLDMEIDSEIID